MTAQTVQSTAPIGYRMLVVARVPVPGRAKTRLAAGTGPQAAARLAACALLDTLTVCRDAVGADRCLLALDGDLADLAALEGLGAGRGRRDQDLAAQLRAALAAGWQVFAQRGEDFAGRLAAAHADAGPGPLLQVGMDTPQLTPALLAATATALSRHDGVLGRAEDGGWWVLGRHDPALAQPLAGVAMSAPDTHDRTWEAITGAGWRLTGAPLLRDVDTVDDARRVAAAAPHSRFAAAWGDTFRQETP